MYQIIPPLDVETGSMASQGCDKISAVVGSMVKCTMDGSKSMHFFFFLVVTHYGAVLAGYAITIITKIRKTSQDRRCCIA